MNEGLAQGLYIVNASGEEIRIRRPTLCGKRRALTNRPLFPTTPVNTMTHRLLQNWSHGSHAPLLPWLTQSQ